MLSRADLLVLKAHCLATGIRISRTVLDEISDGGRTPLTIHEYATTGGITLKMGDVFVNAPFDDWYSAQSKVELVHGVDGYAVRFDGAEVPAEILPLPGYLGAHNDRGEAVTATTMSHCDRIRVSPIMGCSLDCHFCDFPAQRYSRHSADEVLSSIAVARDDTALPAHHMLISGGSPGPKHFDWFDHTIEQIARGAGLPVDVMMSPREGGLDHIRRFAAAGVQGFSLNLEIFGSERAEALMPRKFRRSSRYIVETIAAAVDAVGSGGNVRSLVIVGLDRPQDTLAAVELLCSLGCEPVLSPFRPARNSRLEHWQPPSVEQLLDIHDAAVQIAQDFGLRVGPRCIPCQHNTLVVPDGSRDYIYSADCGGASAIATPLVQTPSGSVA